MWRQLGRATAQSPNARRAQDTLDTNDRMQLAAVHVHGPVLLSRLPLLPGTSRLQCRMYFSARDAKCLFLSTVSPGLLSPSPSTASYALHRQQRLCPALPTGRGSAAPGMALHIACSPRTRVSSLVPKLWRRNKTWRSSFFLSLMMRFMRVSTKDETGRDEPKEWGLSEGAGAGGLYLVRQWW